MALTIQTGNIFTSTSQTLVNTVNCVGVMGAGIALECRLRWPAMHTRYVELCTQGRIQPGLLWIHKAADRWILNFPTKEHWRLPSRERYLHLGLQKLATTWRDRGITSIALPLLGADKGGIDPERSLALIQEYLADLPIPIEIYRYDPTTPDDLYLQLCDWMTAADESAISQQTGIRQSTLDKVLAAMRRPDIRQINQLSQVDGVGIKTLEKLFHAAPSAPRGSASTRTQLRLL